MLDAQFLHIGMTGIADRINMRTAKGRAKFCEQIHRKVDAFVLIVSEFSIPLGKFVADCDRPCHKRLYREGYILSRVYYTGCRLPHSNVVLVDVRVGFHNRVRLGTFSGGLGSSVFYEISSGHRWEPCNTRKTRTTLPATR